MRADPSQTTPFATAPGGRPAQVAVAPVAEAVAAVIFDTDAAAGRSAGRLTAFIDGEVLTRPLVSTNLELRCGGRRHVLLLGQSAERLALRRMSLALGGRVLAGLDPDWLQSPVTCGAALTCGLSDCGRRRLLRLLLTTGASLFGYGDRAAFGAAIGHLLDLLGVVALDAASTCRTGEASRIVSFRLPAGHAACAIEEVIALAPRRITRVAGCGLHVERAPRGAVLHVHLPRAMPAGSTLIGLGETPVLLRTPAAEAAAQPLVPWLARRDAATRRWVRDLLADRAPRDTEAAALIRELACAEAEAPPALRLRHLSRTPAGILFLLDLADPDDLIRAVRIERGAVFHEAPAGRQPLAGFAGLPEPSDADPTCRLRLVWRSGRVQTVFAAGVAAFDGAIPRGFDAAAAAGLATARLTMPRRVAAIAEEAIGATLARPRLSLIVAVGGNLDLIRARAAMLIREPDAARIEVIHHAPAGPLAEAARAALNHVHAVFGLPCRLVTLHEEASPAARLRAALAAARAPMLLVLGAEVLPQGPGWVAQWLRAPRATRGAHFTGGTMIAADGSVLEAGGGLRCGGEGDPARRSPQFRGLPQTDLPRAPSLASDLASADCVGLTQAAAAALCGLTADYPDPDILLAEAVHRLHQEGPAMRILLRSRFVRYRETPPPDALAAAVDAHALGALLRDARASAPARA